MTQICCGPTVRLSGNEYRCQKCDKDVTEKYRAAGLAGKVLSWLPRRNEVKK